MTKEGCRHLPSFTGTAIATGDINRFIFKNAINLFMHLIRSDLRVATGRWNDDGHVTWATKLYRPDDVYHLRSPKLHE